MPTTPRRDAESRPVAPPWLISVVLHVGLVLLLGWLVRTGPRGTRGEPDRAVGIVLKQTSPTGEVFEGPEDAPAEAALQPAPLAAEALAALPADVEAFDPTDALPSSVPRLGPGALEGGGVGGAGDLTRGAPQPRTTAGGAARVEVYGLEAEGHKFVFVFDRSESMAGAPLASAKRQLLAGVEGLETTHQFQIIFFNHRPRAFRIGESARIPFASDNNKQAARTFVGGITAGGGTDRYAALRMAVALRPDVIFFLSDADEPMSPADMDRLRRQNRGLATIHAIEFGFGPDPGGDNFLWRLARTNGGRHTYVDTSQLAD